MPESGPSSWGVMLLLALQKKRADNLYLGTVPAHVKAMRRRKGKAAKRARRNNR